MKNLIVLLIIFLVVCACRADKTAQKHNPTSNAAGVTKADTAAGQANTINTDSAAAISARNIRTGTLYSVRVPGRADMAIVFITNKSMGKYFLTDTVNYIKALQYQNINGTIKLIRQKMLSKQEWTYLRIDSANISRQQINGQPYLYFSTYNEPMGTAFIERDVTFNLLNLNTLQLHTIIYTGRHRHDGNSEYRIWGSFQSLKPVKDFPAVKQALLAAAERSPYLYHPKGSAKSINHYSNFEDKWDRDNKADNHYSHGYGSIPALIYSTYYSHPLFSVNQEDYVNDNYSQLLISPRYIVVNYNQGNILGYDVFKKLYFPIYIESCVAMCSKTVRFVNDVTLAVQRDGDDYDEYINLDKIIFQR